MLICGSNLLYKNERKGMKKLLTLALLVSFAGVHASDSTGSPLGTFKERLKKHPWAGLGGGISAATLVLIAGERDPQKIGTAITAGIVYGIGSKGLLDYVFPALPDDECSNMGKGALGPIGIKFFPHAMSLSNQGTRVIRSR